MRKGMKRLGLYHDYRLSREGEVWYVDLAVWADGATTELHWSNFRGNINSPRLRLAQDEELAWHVAQRRLK